MLPITKEDAYDLIAKLVARFEEQFDSYIQAEYNETKTRRDFIDPFFTALGWDVANADGNAEAYREVIHEDRVKVAKATKSPDYSFKLSGGKRLFFVEAKKPSINVKEDVAPAYQLRRYGWSAKLPISVIMDFQEFSIYDCTIKPHINDKASVARIKYLTFKDYLTEFDFIWDTFSRERVLKGSFDKYIASAKSKRGTATVDEDFLNTLRTWRTRIAKNIFKNNTLDEEALNFVVQQAIDRIIFLRIAEDRGIEPYERLRESVLQGNYYQNLFYYFHEADKKYNSGLFNFKTDTTSSGVVIENHIVKEIIEGLYYPKSPYEFSVISVEILGSAYEQFLGEKIKIDGQQIHITYKYAFLKEQGIYYTPQYIVDYIVQNTVGKLINNKTPKEIEKIKIVDPACGSGSFLLGAYECLLDYHKKYYLKNNTTRGKKDSPITPDGNLSADEKKKILLNNIYGVDLDFNAVEVTKLSLLLKCMEGETEASVNQMKLWHERILPTLDDNIKSGNSLIDLDGEFDFGDEKEIKPFNWRKKFSSVFLQGGFDPVIGNPPYVRQELLGDEQKGYFAKKYSVYHGMADLYTYFFEKGITLLNEKGLFGMIVASKWMRAAYGEPLRRWIKIQNIKEIVDFGGLPVFQGATTYTCIFIVGKEKGSKQISVANVKTLQFDSLEEYVAQNKREVEQKSLVDGGWNLASVTEQKLLQKIKASGLPLKNYVDNKIYYGIKTGLNGAFVIDTQTKNSLIKEDRKSSEIIKPFLVGKDIKRFLPPKSDKYLIFTRRGTDINNYPAIKNYLQQFKKQLMPKPPDFRGSKWEGRKPGKYKWFEIQDTVDYYKEFEKPKILWPGISSAVACFTLDYNNFYGNDNNQLIVVDDKYLLGILNSSVSKFQLLNICDKVQGGFYRLKIIYIEQLVIKSPPSKSESALRNEIIKNVESLLKLNEELREVILQSKIEQLQNKIDYCEEKINEIVYQLYGLTKDEIGIIETAMR